jgi:hypothetical protein
MTGVLDFNSFKYCYSNLRWQCVGRGYDESQAIFLGEPWAVTAALNGLTYMVIID